MVSAEILTQLSLLLAGIYLGLATVESLHAEGPTYSNNASAHVPRVLHSKMPQTAACTGQDDPISRVGFAVLQSAVDRHACTQDRCCRATLEAVRDRRDVVHPRDDILRERSIHSKAAELCLRACYQHSASIRLPRGKGR